MATNPLFTVTFDVKSSDKYGDFLADLRKRLGNPGHFSHNRPVLPPVEPNVNPPRWWFHVVLKTPKSEVTLATRADNLYLEGFRSKDGTWWELTRGFIPGARFVGFGGSYSALLRDTDKLVDVALGPKHMTDAVKVLADFAAGAAQDPVKQALPVILLMVHEATRFVTVEELVAKVMPPKSAMESDRITAEMKAQVNGWQDLSEAMLRTDARPAGPFVDEKSGMTAETAKSGMTAEKAKKKGVKTVEEAAKSGMTEEKATKMGVKTVEEAAKTVGILLFVDETKVKGGMTAATGLRMFHESLKQRKPK